MPKICRSEKSSLSDYTPRRLSYEKYLEHQHYHQQQQQQQQQHHLISSSQLKKLSRYQNEEMSGDCELLDEDLTSENLDYDEDDDIFEDNCKPLPTGHNQTSQKEFRMTSMSTASYIVNQMNLLNRTPDMTGLDSTSSSFSSSSAALTQSSELDLTAKRPSYIPANKFFYLNNNNTNGNSISTKSPKGSLVRDRINKLQSSNIPPSSPYYPSTPNFVRKSTAANNKSNHTIVSSTCEKTIVSGALDDEMNNVLRNSKDISEHIFMLRDFKFPNSPKLYQSLNKSPPPLPNTTQSVFMINSTHGDASLIESLANFSHFDVQSTFFNYNSIKSLINSLHTSLNIKTGASAASKHNSLESLGKMSDANGGRLSAYIKGSINSAVTDTDVSKRRLSSSMYQTTSSIDNPGVGVLVLDEEDDGAASDRSPGSFCPPSANFNLNDSDSTASFVTDLVEDCECFRVELGGDTFKGLGLVQDVSQRRMMKLNSISILDKIGLHYKREIIDMIESNNSEPFMFEYQDWGAYFYRYYFDNDEHVNYVGIDADIGPVVLSLKREKLLIEPLVRSNSHNAASDNANQRTYDYVYRFIMRTSDLNTLRGTILEDHLKLKISQSGSGNSKSISHKDIIGSLVPDLNLANFHLADAKIADKLIDLDEQYIIKNHKIGVLLCKAGQSTEEEMYNNRDSTPAFDEFLSLLGDKVRLKGFNNYRGGLDNMNDTTGTHSIYTKFRNKELMFHVSTLLPYSNNDSQQLTRKRHIGNDLVTIIFQEPGAQPFSPKTIRSQFQHIFIVVRAINPNSYNTQYSVAVSYSKDIPSFGPPLPKNPLFLKSKEFRDFLLAKLVNADNVGLKCEKFTQIRMRTRHGMLKDLIGKYATKTRLEHGAGAKTSSGIKLGFFTFGALRPKKLRSKSLQEFNGGLSNSDELVALSLLKLTGAIFWNVQSVSDFQYTLKNSCYLGISKQSIVIVDARQKCVLFSIGTNAVIGWTLNENDCSFVLYFDLGEYVTVRMHSDIELGSVIKRLEFFTKGCKTIELSMQRKDYGPLGFNIHHDGVVTEVKPFSLAYYRGLKQGTRIVKICDHYVINLTHEKMIDLLRKPNFLRFTFLPPLEDGSARRGQDDRISLYAYLSTCSSMNERQIDSIRTTTLLNNYYQLQQQQQQQHQNFIQTSKQRNRSLPAAQQIGLNFKKVEAC